LNLSEVLFAQSVRSVCPRNLSTKLHETPPRNSHETPSGHVWQGRYYSCPLDQAHLWEALRYTELNPIRAGLVAEAESWRWSSALAHCHKETDNGLLTMEPWQAHWSEEAWREYLTAGEKESELAAIRRCTYTGRPLGTAEFIGVLEKKMLRRLKLLKGGRPSKPTTDSRQSELTFGP
jgi:putative transposase